METGTAPDVFQSGERFSPRDGSEGRPRAFHLRETKIVIRFGMSQSITITDSQHFTVSAAPVDAAGKPGVLAPGSVASWSTSDPTVAVAAVNASDPTGQSATVSAVGPGSCTITCNGTNPAGSFFQGFTCTVTGGNAVGWLFTFGTPS
jgi:hypothetical protein